MQRLVKPFPSQNFPSITMAIYCRVHILTDLSPPPSMHVSPFPSSGRPALRIGMYKGDVKFSPNTGDAFPRTELNAGDSPALEPNVDYTLRWNWVGTATQFYVN